MRLCTGVQRRAGQRVICKASKQQQYRGFCTVFYVTAANHLFPHHRIHSLVTLIMVKSMCVSLWLFYVSLWGCTRVATKCASSRCYPLFRSSPCSRLHSLLPHLLRKLCMTWQTDQVSGRDNKPVSCLSALFLLMPLAIYPSSWLKNKPGRVSIAMQSILAPRKISPGIPDTLDFFPHKAVASDLPILYKDFQKPVNMHSQHKNSQVWGVNSITCIADPSLCSQGFILCLLHALSPEFSLDHSPHGSGCFWEEWFFLTHTFSNLCVMKGSSGC